MSISAIPFLRLSRYAFMQTQNKQNTQGRKNDRGFFWVKAGFSSDFCPTTFTFSGGQKVFFIYATTCGPREYFPSLKVTPSVTRIWAQKTSRNWAREVLRFHAPRSPFSFTEKPGAERENVCLINNSMCTKKLRIDSVIHASLTMVIDSADDLNFAAAPVNLLLQIHQNK